MSHAWLALSCVVALSGSIFGRAQQGPLVVNGETISAKAIRERIDSDDPGPEDFYRARLWFARTVSLRQALESKGAWLNDEQAAERYAAHDARHGTDATRQQALKASGFPSLDDYKLYHRIRESFKDLISNEIDEKALQGLLDKFGRGLSRSAEVECEVLLASAYDFERESWRADGWKRAERRAKIAMRALEDGKGWSKVLDEYSEFPEKGVYGPLYSGRFGSVDRSGLSARLGETDYLQFLQCESLADRIFFEHEEGSVSAPMRGPHGYYICRLVGRTCPDFELTVKDHGPILELRYIEFRLMEYGRKVLEEAEIKGLELR